MQITAVCVWEREDTLRLTEEWTAASLYSALASLFFPPPLWIKMKIQVFLHLNIRWSVCLDIWWRYKCQLLPAGVWAVQKYAVVTSGLKQRWQMGQGSGRRGGSRKLGHHTHIICLSLSLYFALCCLEIFLSFTFTHFFLPLTHTPTQYQSFVIPELTPSRATVAINKLKCVQCLAWPEALERHTHNQYSNP